MTPEYAAPEQVTGGAVTTATDIYALGVLLYVLLSGRHPAGSGASSPADLMKAIVETKPQRLSEVMTAPEKLRRQLRGDLETIVGKALKKNPQERYISVTAMADDLHRYLTHEPISARPDTFAYRAVKFVRRNRTAVALAVVAFVASVAGVVGTMVEARTANRERVIAQRRFNDVRQLSARVPATTIREYPRRSRACSGARPAYMRVARVQGVPISPNLGQMDQAEQNLRIAEGLIQSALVSQPANRSALLRAAQIAHDRMLLARLQGNRGDEAQPFARKSSDWLEKFNAGKSDKPEATPVLTTCMNVADEFMRGRQFEDALRLCRRGSEFARVLNHRPYLGMLLKVAALVSQRRGDLDEALRSIHTSVELLDPGARTDDLGQTMNFALVLTFEGSILGQDDGISLGRAQECGEVTRACLPNCG